MGIFSSTYYALEEEIYLKIPKVGCNACGECCVSPHMTLIEFCYMMTYFQDKPEQLARILSRTVPRHPSYPGNLMCRFQRRDKLCSAYPKRALACRLYGHPVIEGMGLRHHVHCRKTISAGEPIAGEDVYALMERVAELNEGYYSYYTRPYWVSGLNVESWLTILFTDFDERLFRLMKKLMTRELGLQDYAKHFTQRVRMNEKLGLIKHFQADLSKGDYEDCIPILTQIQEEFPETGAYYYFEAELYKKELVKRSSL